MILKTFKNTVIIYVSKSWMQIAATHTLVDFNLNSLYTCLNSVSQQEIVSLYQRFCQLDRTAKGFISADEFLSVPEFAVNPLSQVKFFSFFIFRFFFIIIILRLYNSVSILWSIGMPTRCLTICLPFAFWFFTEIA